MKIEPSKTIIEIYNETVELVDGARKFLPYTRHIDLQTKTIVDLLNLIPWIKAAKKIYAEAGDESNSNKFLYLQSSVYAMVSMLQCIVNIKKENYKQAWHSIIDAEEYIALGLRTSVNSEFLENLSNHREMMEKVLLPEMPFYNSIGALVKGGQCSICGLEYNKCDHIENIIYLGSMCKVINITNLEFNHAAIVENPRDRRCIPLQFQSREGYMKDIFTWIEEEDKEEIEVKEHKEMKIGFIMFSNNRIDSD